MKLFKAMLCSVAALSLLLPAAHAQAAPTVVKIALTQPTGNRCILQFSRYSAKYH